MRDDYGDGYRAFVAGIPIFYFADNPVAMAGWRDAESAFLGTKDITRGYS